MLDELASLLSFGSSAGERDGKVLDLELPRRLAAASRIKTVPEKDDFLRLKFRVHRIWLVSGPHASKTEKKQGSAEHRGANRLGGARLSGHRKNPQ